MFSLKYKGQGQTVTHARIQEYNTRSKNCNKLTDYQTPVKTYASK